MYLLSVCWLIFVLFLFFSRFCACFISACFFLSFYWILFVFDAANLYIIQLYRFRVCCGLFLFLLNLILLLLLVLFICFYFNPDRTISVFRSKHIWLGFFPPRFGIEKNVFVLNVCDVALYGMAAVRKSFCTYDFNKIIVI